MQGAIFFCQGKTSKTKNSIAIKASGKEVMQVQYNLAADIENEKTGFNHILFF